MSFFLCCGAHRDLHSFPTRRSSDLVRQQFGHEQPQHEPEDHAREPADRNAPQTAFQEDQRSEEHTSELQSLRHLVCRLLLEKKKTDRSGTVTSTAKATMARTNAPRR